MAWQIARGLQILVCDNCLFIWLKFRPRPKAEGLITVVHWKTIQSVLPRTLFKLFTFFSSPFFQLSCDVVHQTRVILGCLATRASTSRFTTQKTTMTSSAELPAVNSPHCQSCCISTRMEAANWWRRMATLLSFCARCSTKLNLWKTSAHRNSVVNRLLIVLTTLQGF